MPSSPTYPASQVNEIGRTVGAIVIELAVGVTIVAFVIEHSVEPTE